MKRFTVLLAGLVVVLALVTGDASAQYCIAGPHCPSPNCVDCVIGQGQHGNPQGTCLARYVGSVMPWACGCGWPFDDLCENVGECTITSSCSREECPPEGCGDLRPSGSASLCWPPDPGGARSPKPRRAAMKLAPAPGQNVLTVF
jgi:hypothetical protein